MADDPSSAADRSNRTGVALLAGLGAAAAAIVARQVFRSRGVAPEFRSPAMLIPVPTHTALLSLARTGVAKSPIAQIPPGVEIQEQRVPIDPGEPPRQMLIIRRSNRTAPTPALFFVHGGGYLMGRPEMDFPLFFRILEALDVTIASIDYRLAPEHPFPAPLDDCSAGFSWLVEHAGDLGIDLGRTLIGGISAGGGLAAALVQREVDAGTRLACQLLLYPMLDDRSATKRDHAGRGRLIWSPADNRRGWKAYLGHEPGEWETRPYAVPARRGNLSGLPPAWIGVGSLDLFLPENETYARKLKATGVECELDIVAGGYHAFDLMCIDAPGSRAFHDRMIVFLRRHLFGGAEAG